LKLHPILQQTSNMSKKTNSKKEKGISNGHAAFRKASTLLGCIQNEDFTLPATAFVKDLQYSLMDTYERTWISFWTKKNIIPYVFSELVEMYPWFSAFKDAKNEGVLSQLSATNDEFHAGKTKRTELKSHSFTIAHFMNYRIHLFKSDPLSCPDIFTCHDPMIVFSQTAVKDWTKWVQEFEYAYNTEKMYYSCLCAFLNWLCNEEETSQQQHFSLSKTLVYLRKCKSEVQQLVDKLYAERNIRESLIAKKLYIDNDMYIHAYALVFEVIDTFERELSTLWIGHMYDIEDDVENWRNFSIDDANDSFRSAWVDFLVTKIGKNAISGFRWYAFQKALMYMVNIWCSPQRTENFYAATVNAFSKTEVNGTASYDFIKRTIEKSNRIRIANQRNPNVTSRIVPMTTASFDAMDIWLEWIHPVIVKHFDTKVNGNAKSMKKDIQFMWISANGKNYTTNQENWTKCIYEITLEVFGKGFHARWLRNRFGDLLAQQCKTKEEWSIMCNYMSHTVPVHEKYYTTISKKQSRVVYERVANKVLRASDGIKVNSTFTFADTMPQDDINATMNQINSLVNHANANHQRNLDDNEVLERAELESPSKRRKLIFVCK
jgi:hypothetical protein